MDIYVHKDGQQLGPYPEARVRQGIGTGEFHVEDLAWSDGQNDWRPIREILNNCLPTDSVEEHGVPTLVPSSRPTLGTQPKLMLLAAASAFLSGTALLCALADHKVLWFLGTLSGIVAGHYVCRRTRTQPHERFTRRLALGGLLTGYATTSIYLVFLFLTFTFSSSGGSSDQPKQPATAQTRIEQVLFAQLQKTLEANKQKIFDHVHPLGTAKSVTLHDVTVTAWKHGQDTNRMDDIQEFTMRYTLYWSTALTPDGFTKIVQTYDAESQRYTKINILATNGMTNQDAQGALTSALGTLLQYQAQKAGAEDAAREYYHGQ